MFIFFSDVHFVANEIKPHLFKSWLQPTTCKSKCKNVVHSVMWFLRLTQLGFLIQHLHKNVHLMTTFWTTSEQVEKCSIMYLATGCLGAIKPWQMYFLSAAACNFTGRESECITVQWRRKPRNVFFGKACWVFTQHTQNQTI